MPGFVTKYTPFCTRKKVTQNSYIDPRWPLIDLHRIRRQDAGSLGDIAHEFEDLPRGIMARRLKLAFVRSTDYLAVRIEKNGYRNAF